MKFKTIYLSSQEIRDLRKRIGYTQAEFAKALTVSVRQVTRWERPEGHRDHSTPQSFFARKMLEVETKRMATMVPSMGVLHVNKRRGRRRLHVPSDATLSGVGILPGSF